MNSRFRAFPVAFMALWLCGCATAYRPLKGGKGFAESQISSNEFSISFQGNSQTSLERDYDFVLLRSAEVALQNQFSFFAVMDVTNTSSARPYFYHQRFYSDSPGPDMMTPIPGVYNRYTHTYATGYIYDVKERRIAFRPGTILRIKCFSAKPGDPFTYDAAQLRDRLKRKYKLG